MPKYLVNIFKDQLSMTWYCKIDFHSEIPIQQTIVILLLCKEFIKVNYPGQQAFRSTIMLTKLFSS